MLSKEKRIEPKQFVYKTDISTKSYARCVAAAEIDVSNES